MDTLSNQTDPLSQIPTEELMRMLGGDTEGLDVAMPMDMKEVMEITIDTETGEVMDPDDEEETAEMLLQSLPFNANLAEVLDEKVLKDLGAKITELVEKDKDSRKEWYETLTKGMKALGVYNADDISEAGLRRVTHPMLLEAATQFQARAMTELLPPGGPVKAAIPGISTPELVAQGRRIEQHMNYQLTVEDRTYYDERDQMFFLLPFSGSEFDKQYWDATTQRVVSRWVRCDHFIAPYDAKNLETASRYTHEIRMSKNAYRRAVAAGVYIDSIDKLGDATEEGDFSKALNELDGQEKLDTGEDDREELTLYETHIDLDLPGLEDDYSLPFIVTADADTGAVVGVYRNWKETDELKRKRVWFSHKKFLPGFGFYGFGLLHCIGNLGESATEVLRILLDSGAFATLQGGFKSKDARLKGDVELEPGVWIDTEMTAEELSKAFYTPPFKEPSQVMNALLGMLVAAGEKFASTTETMTGDAATTGPVGTMVAQIEQGSKVFSGIHKRLHKGFGDEFIHIAELNGEHLPDSYPFKTDTMGQGVLRSDYDGRVDIIPVSDPNIFSAAQRMAMAQTAFQMAQSLPQIADQREAAIGLLTAMRFPSPELIFPKKAEAQRMDPVSEISAVFMGRPIKAYLDQEHNSHIAVHQGQLQSLPEEVQPTVMTHIMEHMAMANFMHFAQLGLPLPPMEFYPESGAPMYPDLSPQMETQIALAAAQAMQQIIQQQQQVQQAAEQAAQPPQADPAAEAAQKEQIKQAAFEADQQRKQAAFQAEQERGMTAAQIAESRKNAQVASDTDRKDALSGLSPTLVKQADEFIAQNGLPMSGRELAVLSKALGRPFQDVVTALSRMMLAGQGGSQFPQTTEFHNRDPRFK